MPEMAEAPPPSHSPTPASPHRLAAADLHLICELHARERPLGLSERLNMPGSRLRWNEWITGAKYCDLSADACVQLMAGRLG